MTPPIDRIAFVTPSFVPQSEPLWVGLTDLGQPLSGRVVGWALDDHSARFPRSDVPNPRGRRGRAVVLIHGSDAGHGLGGPTITIDAGWPSRYVASAEEAWLAALEISAEWNKNFEAERREHDAKFDREWLDQERRAGES